MGSVRGFGLDRRIVECQLALDVSAEFQRTPHVRTHVLHRLYYFASEDLWVPGADDDDESSQPLRWSASTEDPATIDR
jgi:hypothetical protein